MPVTDLQREKIEIRVEHVRGILRKRLSEIEDYMAAPEEVKIPLRILQAEKLAYAEYLGGADLSTWLHHLANNEHYCGAQGAKNAIDFINQLK